MKRRASGTGAIGSLVLVSVLFGVGGCDDNEIEDGTGGASSSGGTSATGGSSGSGGTSATGGQAGVGGAAGADGGGSGGAASDAGADVDGGGGVGGAITGCNYLTQLGSQVNSAITAAAAPVPLGGTPVDGFYTLGAVNLFGGATGTTFWRTLRFVGNELKTVERDGAATIDSTTTGTFVVSGTKLTRTLTCGVAPTLELGFTATSTTFTAYESQGGGKLVELVFQYHSQ